MGLGDAVNYVLGSLDKPGRAVRGVLGGNAHEALAALPFSDAIGITNPRDEVTPRALSDRLGLTRPGDTGWGSTLGSFGVGMATDPLNWLPAGMAGKAAAHAFGGTTLGKAVAESRLGRFAGDESGALGLKYDDFADPPKGMLRNDPEWVNNRTFYHGGASPDLGAESIDPMKTAHDNLFGRGIYTTDDPGVARSYMKKGLAAATEKELPPWLLGELREHAKSGHLDEDMTSFFRSPASDLPIESKQKWLSLMESELPNHLSVPSVDWYSRNVPGTQFEKFVSQRIPKLSEYFYQPTVHQSQSGYGNILDLDQPFAGREARRLRNELVESAREHQLSEASRQKDFFDHFPDAKYALNDRYSNAGEMLTEMLNGSTYLGYPDNDPFVLRGLRNAGYDAMTHTGGLRWGNGHEHQVVIGLDPNNTLGIGGASPYRRWEQYLMGRG